MSRRLLCVVPVIASIRVTANHLLGQTSAVAALRDRLGCLQAVLDALGTAMTHSGAHLSSKPRSEVFMALQAQLFLTPAADVATIMATDYARALAAFARHQARSTPGQVSEEGEDDVDEEEEAKKAIPAEDAQCVAEFQSLHADLYAVEILSAVSQRTLTTVLHQAIEKRINDTCRGEFETPMLTHLCTWRDQVLLGWLQLAFSTADPRREQHLAGTTHHKNSLQKGKQGRG